LRPARGEWTETLRVGPLHVDISVPAVLRMATHPLGLRLLSGHAFHTPLGLVSVHPGADENSARVVCDPCVMRIAALSPRPVRLPRSELTLVRTGQSRLSGEWRSGAVVVHWNAEIERDGVRLRIALPDTPLADLYAVMGDAIPELARAHIAGRAGAELHLALPSRTWSLAPRVEGFSVDGLGTDVLLNATPQPECMRPSRAADVAAPFGAWLPKAVIAAEDQRFYEHPGYDLVEMRAAWRSGSSEAARGASTLSQQLAKLLYTGDERSAVRKARELLYAVELDRTLGKARVLQLYLMLAPWGVSDAAGTTPCGAQAAAWQLLRKPAPLLTPIEAAWLASLLRNPRVELDRGRQSGEVDRTRLGHILDEMRPMSRARRQAIATQLAVWAPPPMPASAATALKAASAVP
jgi:hypothetical protein